MLRCSSAFKFRGEKITQDAFDRYTRDLSARDRSERNCLKIERIVQQHLYRGDIRWLTYFMEIL